MLPAGAEKGLTAGLFLRVTSLSTFDLKLGLIYGSLKHVERLPVAGEKRTTRRSHTCAEWGVPPECLLLFTLWANFLCQVHKVYCSLVITRGLQKLSQACVVISSSEKSCRLKVSSTQINKWFLKYLDLTFARASQFISHKASLRVPLHIPSNCFRVIISSLLTVPSLTAYMNKLWGLFLPSSLG